METPFVLLDVDGTLHPLDPATGLPRDARSSEILEGQIGVVRADNKVLPGQFAKPCMDALAEVINGTGAQVVLSSSWRLSPRGRSLVDDQLRRRGLPASTGCTPQVAGGGRAAEILAWAALQEDGCCWVAIDDLPLDALPQWHSVTVDPAHGLTSNDAERVSECLRMQQQKALGLGDTRAALRRRRGAGARSMLRLSAFHRLPTGGVGETEPDTSATCLVADR